MFQSPSSRGTRRRLIGFTLVELLVVIGIIALLISILLPSLNRARQQAYDVQCKSNLRQMGIGLTLYTNEWLYYPGARSKSRDATGNMTGDWVVIWMPRIRKALKNSSHKVFTCPTQKDAQYYWKEFDKSGTVSTAVGKEEGLGYNKGESLLIEKNTKLTYGYNDWGSANVQKNPQRGLGGDIGDVKEVKASAVRSSSSLIVLGDRTVNSVAGTQFSEFNVSLDPTQQLELPATIHRGGSNFLFADGHAEWRRLDEVTLRDPTKLNGGDWTDFTIPVGPLPPYKNKWNTIAPMWNTDNRP